MSLYRTIKGLKASIFNTERLLSQVHDYPLMAIGLQERLEVLKNELESLPKEINEPKLEMLFSGKAVLGSSGIKTSFISKVIGPIQEIIKTQVAIVKFGLVGARGKIKNSHNIVLYLTALPRGSFGIELAQLASDDVFDSVDVPLAIKEVVNIIDSTTKEDKFEEVVMSLPNRTLINLKKILKEISSQESALVLESGEIGIELSKQEIYEAYGRISTIETVEAPLVISGTFRGLLLNSGRFEIIDDAGKAISGFISNSLSEEELVDYEQRFINRPCEIHLIEHKTIFKSSDIKSEYELIQIR